MHPAVGAAHHCLLAVNLTHLLLAGDDGAFLINADNWEWTRVDGFDDDDYYGPECGLVRSPDRGREVVFVYESNAQILNLETRQWRDGPPIPGGTRCADVVPKVNLGEQQFCRNTAQNIRRNLSAI